MLRLINVGNSIPTSVILDPSAQFQAGMVAQLGLYGNTVVGTVSDGTAPLGIIDDVRSRAFTNISWNEVITVPAQGVLNANNQLVTPVDIKAELRKPNILPASFQSTVDVVLNYVNGIITFVAGTPLNIDLTGSGKFNGIQTMVSYTYQVSNIPGDDSTAGTRRMTVWFQRMFCQTDQYETNQQYPLRANLYVSEFGLFTTRRPSQFHPAVALVCAPPSPTSVMLELLWL